MLKALLLRSSPILIPSEYKSLLHLVTLVGEGTKEEDSLIYANWQELYFHQWMQMTLPTATTLQLTAFRDHCSDFYRILLTNHAENQGKMKRVKICEGGKSVGREGESEGEESHHVLKKILGRDSRGNYSLFWMQKTFTQLLQYFTLIFVPPSTSTGPPSAEELEQRLRGKESGYILYCQVMQHFPPTVRSSPSSSDVLLSYLLSILSELHVYDQLSNDKVEEDWSSTAPVIRVIVRQDQNSVKPVDSTYRRSNLFSRLEKEVFATLEILLQENPLPFYQSLHVIVPRLLKVSRLTR